MTNSFSIISNDSPMVLKLFKMAIHGHLWLKATVIFYEFIQPRQQRILMITGYIPMLFFAISHTGMAIGSFWLLPLEPKPFQKWSQLQSTLVISKSKGPSKHFEISVLRHIRFVVLRNKTIWTTKFYKWLCNLTPLISNIYWNIVEKGRSNFSSFPQYFVTWF